MKSITPISRLELIRKLTLLGFSGPYSGGKHSYMLKKELRLTIPNPHKSDISIDLLKRILIQADISKEEWMKVINS